MRAPSRNLLPMKPPLLCRCQWQSRALRYKYAYHHLSWWIGTARISSCLGPWLWKAQRSAEWIPPSRRFAWKGKRMSHTTRTFHTCQAKSLLCLLLEIKSRCSSHIMPTSFRHAIHQDTCSRFPALMSTDGFWFVPDDQGVWQNDHRKCTCNAPQMTAPGPSYKPLAILSQSSPALPRQSSSKISVRCIKQKGWWLQWIVCI